VQVTRAAMDRDMLSQIRPDFVIIEEAAEVLEGNMLGSLLVGSQHISPQMVTL